MIPARNIRLSANWSERERLAEAAKDYGFGLEVNALADPATLNDPARYREQLDAVASELADFPNAISMRGPFRDLRLHSADSQIAKVAAERVDQALEAAAEIGATQVVFQTGYLPMEDSTDEFRALAARQAGFWRSRLQSCRQTTILLENRWERDCGLLLEIVEQSDEARLRLSLDIWNWHRFAGISHEHWISDAGEKLLSMRWNLSGQASQLDWLRLTDEVKLMQPAPVIILETASIGEVSQALGFLSQYGVIDYSEADHG